MVEGKWLFCLQLLQYCYITLLWIFTDSNVVSSGRGEMAVLPAVTAVLIHHIVMDLY